MKNALINKIFIIIFVFLTVFFDVDTASAERGQQAIGNENIGSGPTCTGGSCGGSNIVGGNCGGTCWSFPYAYGLRLTIVDNQGNRVSASYDLISANINVSNLYTMPGKNSKIDYLSYSSLSLGNLVAGQYTYELASTFKSLPNFLDNPYGENKIRNYIQLTPRSKINALFSRMGYAGGLSNFTANNHYLMVEPMVFITYHNQFIGGTATELALLFQLGQTTPAGSGGLGISVLTHCNAPKSAYINQNFFGNKLIGVSGSPGYGMLESSQIIGPNGYGVGLFWEFGSCAKGLTDRESIVACCDDPNYENHPYCSGNCAGVSCAPTISNPAECNPNGYYADSTDWACCITGVAKQAGENGGNRKYCPTYCREEINTYFPSQYLSVEAGKHFIIDPVASVQASRQCKAQIKLDQWWLDYNIANNHVKDFYNEWKKNEAHKISVDLAYGDQGAISVTKTKDEYTCTCQERKNTGTKKKPHYEDVPKTWTSSEACTPTNSQAKTCLAAPRQVRRDEQWTATIKSKTYWWNGIGSNTWTGLSTVYTSNTSEGHARQLAKDAIKGYSNSIEQNIAANKASYESALSTRTSLKAAINDCQNVNENADQSASFTLNYKYELIEDKYRAINLKPTTSTTSVGGAYVDSKANPQSKSSGSAFNDWTCSGSVCRNSVSYNYPKNTMAWRTYTTTSVYNFDADTYRYILKPTGTSVFKESDIPSFYKDNGLYYDVGYSNLPVHYTLAPGNYNYSITFSGIGSGGKFDTRINQNKTTTDQNGNAAYVCHYNVYNQLFGDECTKPNPPAYCTPCSGGTCPPGGTTGKVQGIDVIYRPIDEDNPFPSIKGTGRVPGSNWIKGGLRHLYTNKNYNKTYENWFITQNRGVKTERIYFDRSPMYEMTLTPQLMKQIRAYNKQQKTNDEDYADFELTCTNGRQCLSSFIREKFAGYITGCGTGLWDTCDAQDNHDREAAY